MNIIEIYKKRKISSLNTYIATILQDEFLYKKAFRIKGLNNYVEICNRYLEKFAEKTKETELQ